MTVILRAPAWLKQMLGGQQEKSVEGNTVREVFENAGILAEIVDEQGKVRPQFSIHINGGPDVSLAEQGLDSPLSDGDVITIITPIAGG